MIIIFYRTKLRPTHTKEQRTNRAAQCYGAQRSDGALMVGLGYGLGGMNAPNTRSAHPDVAYTLHPSSLWHSYFVETSDCGDDFDRSVLEQGLLIDFFDKAEWRTTRMDHGANEEAATEGLPADICTHIHDFHDYPPEQTFRSDGSAKDSIESFTPFCNQNWAEYSPRTGVDSYVGRWQRQEFTVDPMWSTTTSEVEGESEHPPPLAIAKRNFALFGETPMAPFEVLTVAGNEDVPSGFRRSSRGETLKRDFYYGDLPMVGTQLYASLCALLMPPYPRLEPVSVASQATSLRQEWGAKYGMGASSPGELLGTWIGTVMRQQPGVSSMSTWMSSRPQPHRYENRTRMSARNAAIYLLDFGGPRASTTLEELSRQRFRSTKMTVHALANTWASAGGAFSQYKRGAALMQQKATDTLNAYHNAVAKELARTLPRRAEIDAIVDQRKMDKLVSSTMEEEGVDEVVTLLVSLDGISPKIWRRVTVPTKISLHALHDQVLAPTLGWRRAYHAYAFRPRAWRSISTLAPVAGVGAPNCTVSVAAPRPAVEGEQGRSWIGPTKSTALDAMLAPLFNGGEWAGDSKKVRLGDLLNAEKTANPSSMYGGTADSASEGGGGSGSGGRGRWEGVHLDYLYDLGDTWHHTIRVVAPMDYPPRSSAVPLAGGAVQPYFLSGGFGACPVEDSGGVHWYTDKLRLLSAGEGDTGALTAAERAVDKHWWTEMHTCLSAGSNAADNSGTFDPRRFDIKRARARLAAAVGKKANPTKKATRFMQHSVHPAHGNVVQGSTGEYTTSDEYNAPDEGDAAGGDGGKEKACAVCGVAVGLSACGGCGVVWYCSIAHQKQHWKEGHKGGCKKKKKGKKVKKKKKKK